MKKTRDWLDYTAIGAEVVQAAQLSSISSNLENLSRLCAAQANAQAEQQDREERTRTAEDRIREFAFQGERLITDMRKRIDANPRGALFVASRLQRQIKTAGIATSRVRHYQDKECVQRLLDGVVTFCKDCESQLSSEDKLVVQKCLEYQFDEPQLRQAIEWAKEQDASASRRRACAAELQEKQRELDAIPAKSRPRFHPAVSYTALAIALLALVPPVLFWRPQALLLLGWIGAYFMWIFLAGIMRQEIPEVAALRSEIASLAEEAAEPPCNGALPQFVAKLGRKSAAEYEELLRTRQQAIDEILEPNRVTRTNK